MAEEFAAASKHVIVLVNKGKITMKTRGKKREHILKDITETRKKTVKLVKRQGLKTKEKFKAVRVEKWKKKNPSKDPVTEGYPVKLVEVPRRGKNGAS